MIADLQNELEAERKARKIAEMALMALSEAYDCYRELYERTDEVVQERDKAEARIARALKLVAEQANDGALWDEPIGGRPIAEAYALQELRRLHAMLEDEA